MQYRYNVRTGVQKLKTRSTLVIQGIGLGIIGLATALVMPLAASAAVSQNYTLFGDATIVSGGNPDNAVQMISNSTTTTPYGGVAYTDAAGITFNQLTNLSTDYKITAGDCAGGSPRFQINIGGNNVFVYIGPAPNFTGCTLNTWESTGNLTALADVRFDTSQFSGGSVYNTYAQAEALLGPETVTGVQLVADGGWAVTGGNQTVLADNTQINDNTYTYEPAPTPAPTKDSCKNGGWKTMKDANENFYKNQGNCVSFFASNGKSAH